MIISLSSPKRIKIKLDFTMKTCYTESVRLLNVILPTFNWNAINAVWEMF